jgi:hypothetical protein
MQNNNINVSSVLADITNKSDKDLIEVIRHGYDPKGNRHCFNFGMGPAWWDMQGSANLTEFTRDPMVLLKGAGLDFDVVKALTVSQLPDGNIIESSPKEYNLLRSDDLKVKLQTGVTGGYNITPYREIVQIPNEVIIKPSDFGTDVVSFLQGQHENVDLQDAEMSVNELLSPAGASCWQQGKVMTFQYFIGSFEPRPGDAHRVYFNIESSLDGSKATRYYLTIVRVVCENTQMHAEQDGWAKLLGADKQRQRIRRTSNMDVRIQAWRDGIGSVLAGAAAASAEFKRLASIKIADSREQREKIIRAFVEDSFDLKPKSESKQAVTRSRNMMDKILELAIFEDQLGGGKCETWFDLWNGITSWHQHFTQVNGLASSKQEEEKRYMNLLLNDSTKLELQKQFVHVMAMTRAA